MRFRGKTVVVTGANGNFGGVAARMIAAEGGNIALLDIKIDKLGDVEKECREHGVRVSSYQCDVTDEARVEAVISEVLQEFGEINGLFNNAGYQGLFEPVDRYPTEDFKRVLDINVTGVFNLLKHTSKAMIAAKKGGSICNTASCAGLGCPPSMVAYGTSKAAVCHMTKISALDLAPHNIRVNSISPAFIGPEDGFMWKRQVDLQAQTNPTDAPEYYYPNDPDAVAKAMVGSVPLRRVGTVEEVINAVMFLLSDHSSYITGTDINISGGNVIGGGRG